VADLTLTDGAYRALLIPDPRFTYEALDLSASTVTQDGARAGVPEPVRSTRGVLEATGEQDNETLTITAKRGGFAREIAGAAFTWESTGVTGEIGWETPTAINDLAPVVVTTPTYARDLASAPAVLALPDGRILTAFNRQSTATLDKTRTRTKLPDGTWLSAVDVGRASETTVGNRNRCALAWDDSRQEARLYVLWRDATVTGQERGRLSLYTSSDGGVSWLLTQDDCLTTPLDWSSATEGYTVTGISLALAGGALGALLIGVTSNDTAGLSLVSTVLQYASGDGGFTFDLVEAYAPTSTNDALGGVSFTVYADPGGSPGFRVVWSSATSSDVGTIWGADLGSPYTPWSSVSGAAVADLGSSISSIGSKVLAPVAVTLAVDPIGAVWVYYSPSTNLSQRVVALQISSGGVGRVIGDVAGLTTPWAFGPLTAAEGLEEIAATFSAGGVVLIGRLQSATSSAYVGALIALTLGGYTGATRRPVTFGAALGDYNAPYEVDWYGVAAFGDFTSWAAWYAGTPALSLNTSLGFVIDCSGSIFDSYRATYTPTNAGAVQGHAQIIGQVTAGTADVTVKSAAVFNVRLRISASQIVVRNMTAAADLETIALPGAGAHIVRVSWHQGLSSTVYWRVEVTPWTQGATVRAWDAYDGTLSAAASAGDRFRLDVNNAGIGVFYHLAFAAGDQGAGMAEDTLTPRPFSVTPAPVYHGVNVALTAGPVVGGDSWTIAPAYDFGIARVFQEVEPSPRAKFKARASSTASATRLVIDLTDGGEPTRLGSPVLGLGIFGANFRTLEVYTGATSSGAWTLVGTADMSCGLSGLAWERVGYTVSAPASTPDTGPHYIPENALAGGSFRYKSGEAVRILRNTGGVWQNGSAVKRPRLTLDGPSADASGTGGVIVYPDAVLLLYGLTNLSFLRLVIPAQDTPSGVVELGSLVFGRVEILGKQYGRGRSLEVLPNVDTFTASNGSRRTRALAPPRRLITVDWQDNAIDTRGVYSSPGSADYVRAAPGLTPAAYVAATADQVRGLIGGLEGAPLVYISQLTPDQPAMISPISLLRGRALGPLTVDAVQGDEEEDEVVRVAGLTIEEEL
jgi:hypothetical protein